MLLLLAITVAAGLPAAQPVVVTTDSGQQSSSRWGSNVQVTDRSVFTFDVDYRANGDMWLACVCNNVSRDTVRIYHSSDGGLVWTGAMIFVGNAGRKFTDIDVVCGDTLLYVFVPQDTAAGPSRDYMLRTTYTISLLNWPHFAAGAATGIIDQMDADRSGLPGDTMCIFYHTTVSNGMSLVHSYDRGSTWSSVGMNFNLCSSPAITWIKDGQWAAAYKYNPFKRNTVYKTANSGQTWGNWVYFDSTALDTLNNGLSMTACHSTGQIMVATSCNTGEVSWGKDIKVYCATDGGNTEFIERCNVLFLGDQDLPVVNCLRFGGNDWGNLAYCDYGYGGDSIRYGYNNQGGLFSEPTIVSDRPGAGAATPLQPRIAYCDDGGHPGPAIFYAGAGRQGLYMNAGWVSGISGKPEYRISKYELRMGPNQPNPFKQFTTINYQLPKAGRVRLNVYNIAGQLVRTLVDGSQASGSHVARWDGRDERGREIAAGVYVCRLDAGGTNATRKLVHIK
jgi:hypothetical protein